MKSKKLDLYTLSLTELREELKNLKKCRKSSRDTRAVRRDFKNAADFEKELNKIINNKVTIYTTKTEKLTYLGKELIISEKPLSSYILKVDMTLSELGLILVSLFQTVLEVVFIKKDNTIRDMLGYHKNKFDYDLKHLTFTEVIYKNGDFVEQFRKVNIDKLIAIKYNGIVFKIKK